MEEPSDVNDFGIMDEASLHLGTAYIVPVSLGAQVKLSINVPNVIHSSGHPLSGLSTIIIKSYFYYMSSLTIKSCYSLCCLLSMQCQDYSNTKCHLYIYNQSSHTIVYAASILYTRPSYTFINAFSYYKNLYKLSIIYKNSKQIL
ncbi:unnamed protein product [Mucor circinelloides]